MNNIKIAAILTVFNRRQKTLSCLQHLFAAVQAYNSSDDRKGSMAVVVYLTDDGSSDGTADAIGKTFPTQDIHILHGTGNLFWAGGMRLAWQEAIDSGIAWDYYLLLNNDTYVYDNLFMELFAADEYGMQQKCRHGISSGIVCEIKDKGHIIYGGFNFANRTKGRHEVVKPTGRPQQVDLVSGNILLVHKTVVDTIGIFYNGFHHDLADHDYNMTALRHDIPVAVTPDVCGECEFDHDTDSQDAKRLVSMTLSERKKYLNTPTRSDHDYLLLIRRQLPMRYPMTLLLRNVRLYWPSLYYHITRLRGVYKDN